MTTILIVLVLLLGCSKSNKPNDEQKAKINEATDRLINANAVNIDLVLEMKPEKREQLNDAVSANMGIKYAKARLPLDFDLIFKINVPDEDDASMNIYKKGSDVYMDFMEQKMKIDIKQIPQVGTILEFPFSDIQSKTTDINFDKATVVLENNQLVYTFDLNDLLQSDTFKKALAEQGHDVDLDFKQGQAIVKVGEEIENMDLSFMVTEKNSMELMELMITTEVVGLNDSVEMSFPNFDAFIDMTQLYQ